MSDSTLEFSSRPRRHKIFLHLDGVAGGRHRRPMITTGNAFMAAALDQARAAAARGEVPVGAIIVDPGGKILGRAGNRVVELKDPTAHAEMLVIRAACAVVGSERLPDCHLYVTLEPCAMCAQAISFARLSRVYYGADDPKGGGTVHGARIFAQSTCHHRPEVYGGIGERAATSILKDFFAIRR